MGSGGCDGWWGLWWVVGVVMGGGGCYELWGYK